MFARWRDANAIVDRIIAEAAPAEPSAADRQIRADVASALGTIDRLLFEHGPSRTADALLEVRSKLAPAGSSLLRPPAGRAS